MARLQIGVLVSGNGSNLQAILDAAARRELDVDVRVVISNKPGVPALARAERAGVPALCVPSRDFPNREAFDARVIELLSQHGVEWIVLAGFMRLLTPAFLARFPDRVINIHPALLPAFPGTDAIRQAFEHGVRLTGCTVHLVDEGIDNGAILAQSPVPVLEDDTEETLAQRMHVAEHLLYVSTLKRLTENDLIIAHGEGRPRVSLRPR
jgi:phosphoribosylglycinamide formyltransferase-1